MDSVKVESKTPEVPDIEKQRQRLLFMLPFLSLLAGMALWLTDAAVNVFLLDSNESFLECVFLPRVSEMWMRILVVIVLVGVGYFARFMLTRQDYLTKSLMRYQAHLEDLVKERTAELMEKQEELENLATTDPLTGAYNRRKFTSMLDTETQLAERYGRRFCLLLLDIDHFKQINDTFGHEAGDRALIAFSKLVQSNLRMTDSFCRWGGEEFMVLLPETDKQGGFTIAEKIRQACGAHDFGEPEHITISIGIGLSDSEKSRETIVSEVDRAMYRAKERGRNRVEFVV